MKHKNLITSYKSATDSQEPTHSQEPTISGAETVRLSKSQASLLRLEEFKIRQEIIKRQALDRLHNRKITPVEPTPPARFEPNKFAEEVNKSKIYWGEFYETFQYIHPAWRFTKEDYKRFWLLSAGATVPEIANITGYSIEPIERWMVLIQRKIVHNKYPSEWIQKKVTTPLGLSATASASALGIDSDKANRLDLLHKVDQLKRQAAKATSTSELQLIMKEIELLKGLK